MPRARSVSMSEVAAHGGRLDPRYYIEREIGTPIGEQEPSDYTVRVTVTVTASSAVEAARLAQDDLYDPDLPLTDFDVRRNDDRREWMHIHMDGGDRP